jgi:lysophospholipase L1-like esterase
MNSKVDIGGRAKRAAAWLALLLLQLPLLVSCGGGTQVERFVPTRVIAFGDETSVIDDTGVVTANGRKYTVNGYGTDGVSVDCRTNLLWTQYLAGQWNLVFPQCNPTGAAAPSRIYATAGAKVADIAAQITAAGVFEAKDLTTVLVGANDIFELYAQYPGVSEADLTLHAQARATALAAQIARIVSGGAKVVFATIPELGSTPFAAKEEVAHPNEGRAGLLTRLTARFNAQLRTAVSNTDSSSFIDGHQGVQVLADELFRAAVSVAGTTGAAYLNVSVGICDPTLAPNVIDCTTGTLLTATTTPALITGGTVSNYLWADDKHLSPGGQAVLGSAAASRTNANPL